MREERTTGIFLDERASLLAKGANVVPTCRLSFSYFVQHVRRIHQITDNFSLIVEVELHLPSHTSKNLVN